MSPDSFTSTEEISWGSRLLSSITGVLVGVILVLAAFPVLFWNEGRAVRRAQGLAQGRAAVVSILPDTVDPANDRRLIHFTGQAATAETVTDPQFGVSDHALRLVRGVQMFQWVEEKSTSNEKQLGGGTKSTTTYTYSRQWRPELVPSDRFSQQEGHVNPAAMALAPDSWLAPHVTVGAFTLPAQLVRALPATDPVNVPATLAAATDPVLAKARASGAGYYIGDDANNPQVGDMKIAFTAARPMDVSVLGQQIRGSVGPYLTASGTEILRIEPGVMAADVMFQHTATENAVVTWVLRGAGFLAMLLGIILIFRPLVAVADVVPFVGDLLGAGIGVLAVSIAVPMTFITIATAWLVYRPLVGAALLAAGVAAFVLFKNLTRKPATAPPARAV